MEALLLPEADHMPEVDQLLEAKAAMRVPPGLVARLDQPTESEFNIKLYTKHR